MKTTHLKTSRTARFFTLNDSDLPIREVLFILHGYGMSAAHFIEEFRSVAKPGRLIVAPEGLSRFYKKGFAGDVVASWMTREDRREEICDYIEYLDKVYESLIPDPESVQTIVLGYSQGASTASRWVMTGKFPHRSLILWSGEFAPDIDQLTDIKSDIWNVIGNKDEFITIERFSEQTINLKKRGFHVREHVFQGGHIIDQKSLENIIRTAFAVGKSNSGNVL